MLRKLFFLGCLFSALALLTPRISAQTCTPVVPDLISWYSADGNALDSRFRNNGTLENGAAFAAGQVEQAFNFDGTNGIVRIPENSSLRPNNWTLEAWIFPRSLRPGPDGYDAVMTYGSTTNTTNGYFLGFRDAKPFTSINHPVDFTLLGDNTSVSLNQWHHLASTFDGITLNLYLNGTLINSVAANGTLPLYDVDGEVLIGADLDNNTPDIHFNGLIDEPAIYNRALTATEIAAVHAAGQTGKCKPTATVAPDGQVGWWSGDGDAQDFAGTNNATLEGGTGFAVGKVGQSFNLDGTNDSVRLPLTQSFQNFTLETWVKPLSAVDDSINQELILGQAGFGAQLAIMPGTNGGMRVKIQYRDTINSFAQLTSTTDIPLNDWSHLSGTYDGTTLKVFINGVLNAQLTPANTAVLTCNTPYFIGGFQPVTDCNNITNPPFQFFHGLIDEASVYNRALTDAEITSIVNAGIAGKLKQNATVDTNSLISLWRGETNANDTRGANNGTFAANTYAAGRVGQAFQINGGIVSVPDSASLDFTDAYTIEMWFAPAAVGTAGGFSFLACKGDCALANNQPYSMGFLDDRKVYLTVGNNSTIDRLISNSALPLNSLSHVAGAYDGTTMRIYINGVLDSSKTTTIGTLVNSSSPFVIGGSNQFGNTPGIYDEVALYNRALTAAEVRANFEAGNALSTIAGDARITFPSVITAGTTQQIPLDRTLFPALTTGTHTGLFYDIDTSAAFTGNSTVCFNLPAYSPSQFSILRVMHFENNNWVDVTASGNQYPTLCTTPVSSFSPFAIASVSAPTAAEVSVGGRVLSGKRGIARARVSMTDQSGAVRTATANAFGYYRFDKVEVGKTYVLTVKSRGYKFAENSSVLFVGEETRDVNFSALR